ncbi:hypothetical protein SAMN06265171_101586 [Chryseobacterium rhizoplanae]|uniref:Uncharacterized protein n=1 Tax=Chryseobacterium rhizoplanae TaxID=1609531 RepID=A0A521B013_9FLAO|nr:hypothetical protein [Chryseobacterium rhizoplanae]SMO40432.1 hypothetical protein SAMN06265171_101586 [Chryseobacterium rhizoplanae]
MNQEQLQELRNSIQQHRSNQALEKAELHMTNIQSSNNPQYALINGEFVKAEMKSYKQSTSELMDKFDNLINSLENIIEQNP